MRTIAWIRDNVQSGRIVPLLAVLLAGCGCEKTADEALAPESIVVSIECLHECEDEHEEAVLEAVAEVQEEVAECGDDQDCIAAAAAAWSELKVQLVEDLETCRLGCRGAP